MLYVSYSSLPKDFKPFIKKNQRDYTLAEAERQLKAYQSAQTSSFFEMPKLEIKQKKTGRDEILLKVDLKSNDIRSADFSLESYLEDYLLSNYMDFPDFETLRQELSESMRTETLVSDKKEGKKWLPILKKKGSDQEDRSALALTERQEYDFTQDFTEEEWALAESEAEETESFEQQEEDTKTENKEEASFGISEEATGIAANDFPKNEPEKGETHFFEKELLLTIQKKVEGWQAVLADPQKTSYERQIAHFQLEREQEKLELLENLALSHERSLAYLQAEKEAESQHSLDEQLTMFRAEKEKEYEQVLKQVEERAKVQYAEERQVFQQRLEAEKQAQQSILERNYQQALAQLEDRLQEKERIKKEELAEKGNLFLEQEYARRKTALESEIEAERNRLTNQLIEEIAISRNTAKEALLQKRHEALNAFDEETEGQLIANKEKWYDEFVNIEKEIQQTEKSKEHRIKAETYHIRAKGQLEEALREKELQIAALRAEVDKVEKEYQLFMAKERVEQQRKEETLQTYQKEKEELTHHFKTFLEVNSQKQKAGMVLSASSFLVMVIVLLSTLL
jgi:hypothetical protein